jgi:(S)-2-hydroxyglutarate dehydrogenase
VFMGRPGALHVLNAPSPAATAALAIGDEIVRRTLAAVAPARRVDPLLGTPAGGRR